MGADMLISAFARPIKETTDDFLERIYKAIDERVTMELLHNNDEAEEIFSYLAEKEERDIDEIKKDFKQIVKEFEDCLNTREVTFIDHKGDRIFLTGGMSWGDSPTDAMEKIEQLNRLVSILGLGWWEK